MQTGKSSQRFGQQSPGRDSAIRLSWRCSGIDQKASVMREEPPWDLLVLVLFFFSDFLEKLPCLCKVECGVTSGLTQVWHPHLVPPVPRKENFPLHFLHDWSPGKSLSPNANSSPSLPLHILPFHPPRHICPCFWQPLTVLSPQFHKPLPKCSPTAPHWASPNTLCPPFCCFPWQYEHTGNSGRRNEGTIHMGNCCFSSVFLWIVSLLQVQVVFSFPLNIILRALPWRWLIFNCSRDFVSQYFAPL